MKHGTGWHQFASDSCSTLATADPVAFNLRAKAVMAEKKRARVRREWLQGQRTVQAQNLARRKAERETVENYTQTPYRAAIGLTHGVDVMTTLFNEIDGKMNRAIKIKADKVLGKFASYMRVNMLRVSDMIERVDTSCDGVVDEEELAAAIKMVKLDLTEDEISTLFKFLDDDNSGHIDAQELEAAMRDFRRANYESTSLKSYIARTAATVDSTREHMPSDKVVDMRLISVGIKGKSRQINCLPALGQHLIHKRIEADMEYGLAGHGSMNLSMSLAPKLLYENSFEHSLMAASMRTHDPIVFPPSGVQQQADMAIHQGNVRDRGLEQAYANTIISRRANQRGVVKRRQAQREMLESKAGQRAENDYAKAVAFYEGVYGEVEITVKEARNIEMADANGTDGVCKIHFGDNPVEETSVQWNTLHPVWNETFKFTFKDPEELKQCIKVELYDQDPHEQEYLGETSVRVEALEPMRVNELVVELQKASTGTMFMSVVLVPVEQMIEEKAKQFKEEKKALAGKLSPRLEAKKAAEAKQLKRAGSKKQMVKSGNVRKMT